MSAVLIDALRPLFDRLTDGVCVTDSAGRLLYANDAAGRLLGPARRKAEESALCGPLCGGIEGAACGTDAANCPLKISRGPETAVTFTGTHAATGRDLRVRCLRVSISGDDLHLTLVTDDTAAAELERHKDDWRRMLAHDVRNPLTMALGSFRLFEEMGPQHVLDYEDLELIKSGVRNCRRIERLLDDYLQTDRLAEGAMPVRLELVDVPSLVRQVVAAHKPGALKRQKTVTGDAPAGLAARADPELLRRALTNLVDNALKFTADGGLITVIAYADAVAGSVRIRVADDGPGIPAADLERIFDRYYQVTNAAPRHGLGLGLTFCRAALRAMGGDISVESEKGKGSAFTLTVPRAEGGS